LPPSDVGTGAGLGSILGLLPGASNWRAPRLRVLANGAVVSGAIEADVSSNNHYAADRFRASIALGPDPFATAEFWSSQTGIMLDVQFSLDAGASFVSLIQGLADTVSVDITSSLLCVEGRDLTAALIEARTQETFANRTSSEIATILAQRHDLTPVVASTSTPVGRYYQNEHDRTTLNQFSRSMTEWDLLIFLAGQEGFDVYVSGTALYFQPGASDPVAPWIVTPQVLQDLRLERSLTLARDIVVTVKSWNSRQQTAFEQTARASGIAGRSALLTGTGQPPQTYVFVRPNLTMDEALKLAQQKLAELTIHERVWEALMPGDLTLTARSMIQLVGTGTDFDQTYFVDVIDRHLSPTTGFEQRIRAKNSSPRTQSTTPADIVAAVTG
jgi:hypothetical protein